MSAEGGTLVGSRVAFFSGTTLLARELRALLEARSMPVTDVRLYDASEAGTVADFAGEALVVTAPDEETILGLDVGFMCGTAAQTEPYLDWAPRRHFTAIDLSGAALARPEVPLVHTEINPAALAAAAPPAIVANPHAVSHNLSLVLAAAQDLGGVREAYVTALLPASAAGEPGIDELYKQTLGLLNFAEVPHDVFGRQLAFNMLPACGPEGGLSRRITQETARITGIDASALRLMPAEVPLFHGHALSVTLRLGRTADVEELKQAIAERRGLRIVQDVSGFSPVELAGEEGIAVLVPTDQPSASDCLSLWTVCDNLKDGAALNAARIAERILDRRRGQP